MHIPTFVFIFILFQKNILLLLLYPKHVIKPLWYNLGCYSLTSYLANNTPECEPGMLEFFPPGDSRICLHAIQLIHNGLARGLDTFGTARPGIVCIAACLSWRT